jgi:hypothetical protein
MSLSRFARRGASAQPLPLADRALRIAIVAGLAEIKSPDPAAMIRAPGVSDEQARPLQRMMPESVV